MADRNINRDIISRTNWNILFQRYSNSSGVRRVSGRVSGRVCGRVLAAVSFIGFRTFFVPSIIGGIICVYVVKRIVKEIQSKKKKNKRNQI